MICVDFVENALFASFGVIADSIDFKLLDFSGQLTFYINRTRSRLDRSVELHANRLYTSK